jgi:hypothetical protein
MIQMLWLMPQKIIKCKFYFHFSCHQPACRMQGSDSLTTKFTKIYTKGTMILYSLISLCPSCLLRVHCGLYFIFRKEQLRVSWCLGAFVAIFFSFRLQI